MQFPYYNLILLNPQKICEKCKYGPVFVFFFLSVMPTQLFMAHADVHAVLK